jgi:hypothetical protein
VDAFLYLLESSTGQPSSRKCFKGTLQVNPLPQWNLQRAILAMLTRAKPRCGI